MTQETASGSLVQMISRILSRMEEQAENPRVEALRVRSVSQIDNQRGNFDSDHLNNSDSADIDPSKIVDDPDKIYPVHPEVAELLEAMITAVANGKNEDEIVFYQYNWSYLEYSVEVDGVSNDDKVSTVSIPASPVVRPREESVDSVSLKSSGSNEEVAAEDNATGRKHCTIWEKDAYNVFRSLCKLSMKPCKEPADIRYVFIHW